MPKPVPLTSMSRTMKMLRPKIKVQSSPPSHFVRIHLQQKRQALRALLCPNSRLFHVIMPVHEFNPTTCSLPALKVYPLKEQAGNL